MTSYFARTVAALALLAISSIAAPVVHADEVTMMGQGLQSCATWTHKRDAAMTDVGKMERAGAGAWISGFLSAAGWYAQAKNPLLSVQMVEVLDYVDKYCTAHPDDPMVRAAVAFVANH